jgi:uncharacterized protein YycO
MAKRIFDLERELVATRKALRRSKHSAPAAMPASAAKSMSATWSRRAAPGWSRAAGEGLEARGTRARAKNAIDARISGTVPETAQPNTMVCWATVYTMLNSWRRDSSTTMEAAVGDVGARWLTKLKANQWLLPEEKVDFIADAGLVAEPPMNPSIQGWADMVANYGPIWVTTDEAPGQGWAIHARIIVGITGDGTDTGTILDIIDPNGGRRYKESFGAFLPKFESEARDRSKDFPLRIQIVHWPAGVKSMSIGRRRVTAYMLDGTMTPSSPREALRSALVTHGVLPDEANRLIATFEMECVGTGSQAKPLPMQPPAPTPLARGLDAVTAEERIIARDVLTFFYPGIPLSDPLSDDHVRLAARMAHAAMEKQKMLNRLPDVPTSPPGIGWLVKQGVKILWREISGPKGISVMARNAVALQWRTTLEEIQNELPPTALSNQPRAKGFSAFDWVSRDIPLGPDTGGRSIDTRALEIGDILVSTTSDLSSAAIRLGMHAPVSHAGLYVGGGMVVEAVAEGVRDTPLEALMRDAKQILYVAFRYPGLTPEQGLRVRDYVGRQLGRSYDYKLVLIRQPLFQAGRRLCSTLPLNQQEQCSQWVGKVAMGKGDDTSFICSELISAAFAAAGVPLTSDPASWTTPGDIPLNVNLEYVGHLKA